MTRQKLGQHFLIDRAVAHRQIAFAGITSQETVLEIGPGKGVLTFLLAQKAKQVIAIEIDKTLVCALRPHLPDNVLLLEGDALAIDFQSLPPFTKIVSNLPYQISSPITFKFFDYHFTKAILMFQKDFAQRLVAQPKTKDYGRLTVGVTYFAHCDILEDVPRTSFSPMPQVDSCIVQLIPQKNPPFHVVNAPFFFDVTKQLFTHRRKKIKYTVSRLYKITEPLPYLEQRVEELSPDQIGELSNTLWNILHP